MIGKATVNLQDSFLNQVRKDNSEIEMVLVNGTHLTGLVRGFDNFTVVVNAAGKQHLVYKHAIAQIVSQRPIQDTSAQQAGQGQGQNQPREQREQREPREPREQREPRDRDRERRPQQPRGERPQQPRPEPVHGEQREAQQPQQPRPEKKEQQQPGKDKFNVLDFSDVKLDQQKS